MSIFPHPSFFKAAGAGWIGLILAIAAFAGATDAAASASICDAAAGNLITNCGFETGAVAQASLGFTSAYAYTSNLGPPGTFYIGNNPDTYNGFFGTPTATPNSGNDEMIINGANVANVTVWEESGITVLPNTNYFFSVFVASVDDLNGNVAMLDFSANGTQLGSIFNASSTPGQEEEFFATFFSGSATTVDLALVNQSTAFAGNDFALDDFVFNTTAPSGGTGVGGTGTGTTPTSVPEPPALLLLAGALAMLVLWRHYRRIERRAAPGPVLQYGDATAAPHRRTGAAAMEPATMLVIGG